ncbi:TRAP transporter small permease subunit [Roseovarius ramblicola]|uniref:TRAP transporter small permease protein n=1 Tax=Roseovarius ramblicola TaxID=2022336 RepID=A0ABV5HYD6_9RHOB
MPSISFILPHWLYWGGLIVFPLVAMIMARRGSIRSYSLPIGYMILVTGGILGLHRLYLRNLWGLLYLLLFFTILFANAQGRDARELHSDASNTVASAERVIDRLAPKVAGADDKIADLRTQLGEAEEGSFAEIRAERMLEKAITGLEEDSARLEQARADLEEARPRLADAQAGRDLWSNVAFGAFLAICAFMAVDAVLLPAMVRNARARLEAAQADASSSLVAAADTTGAAPDALEVEEAHGDMAHIGTGWTGAIDRLSYYAGEFVSYWAVIAVFCYYFEVVARYVFNSPTIWVHEGMFLMFGMQYLIAGAYAALTDAHVKVDVFYAEWSPRRKAVVDLLTSIFFFIFAGTLLATGWIFAMDATRVGEVSFSEWKIAYWPFKWAIAIGAVLLILQGIAKLARDVAILRNSLKEA